MSTVSGQAITRRELVTRGTAGLALAAGAGYGADRLLTGDDASRRRLRRLHTSAMPESGQAASYMSMPELHPPALTSTGRFPGTGQLLLAPGGSRNGTGQGPYLIDRSGQPLWFAQLGHPMWATNFMRVNYRGAPALAWWQGDIVAPGFGIGEGLIINEHYRQLATVRAQNGRDMDLHVFTVTPAGTALFSCHPTPLRADLTAVGGPADGQVLESVIQEVDLASGRLLMEWRSLDHVPIGESYKSYTEPYDYFHANSVEVLPDGNLLLSARHVNALYKLERYTGRVMWRLGGKRSDFALTRDARFSWQHDAAMPQPGLITLFDNGSNTLQVTRRYSRGVALNVDEGSRRVSLRRAYLHAPLLTGGAMGSVQLLPSGNVLVGWGTAGHTTEFTPDGQTLGDLALPTGLYSYRSVQGEWTGVPHSPPQLHAGYDGTLGRTILWASWNGDTRTVAWRVHAGDHPSALRVIGLGPRRGFETVVVLPGRHRYTQVVAQDAAGTVLGRSAATPVTG